MSETAGWGTPGWLPRRVAASIALSDARDAVAERERQAERERVAEDRHARALELHREQMAARGLEVSALDYATGKMPGRTVADVLADAVSASDRQDQMDAVRLHREGHGEPAKLHVFVGEPNLVSAPASRSSWLAVWHRNRRFTEWQARKAEADAARAALDSALDTGLVCEAPRGERP